MHVFGKTGGIAFGAKRPIIALNFPRIALLILRACAVIPPTHARLRSSRPPTVRTTKMIPVTRRCNTALPTTMFG